MSEWLPPGQEELRLELRLQRLGARLMLEQLLGILRGDWNSAGIKLWAENQLEALDE